MPLHRLNAHNSIHAFNSTSRSRRPGRHRATVPTTVNKAVRAGALTAFVGALGLTVGNAAQAAMYDALLFFVVMMVASSLVHVYQTQIIQAEGIDDFAQMQDVALLVKGSMMQMTLYNTTYLDGEGNLIELPPMSTRAQDLLLLELELQLEGMSRENFYALESDVCNELRCLIPVQYEFAFSASVNINDTSGGEVGLFSVAPDEIEALTVGTDICCEEWCCPMPSHEEDAVFRLMLWQ